MEISIVLPTYNEAENIKELIPQLKKEFPKAEILVVDDSSPDGTAKVAKSLGVRVIVRKKKEGIGAALAEGYRKAKGGIIMSMDADGSISVESVRILLKKLQKYDLVVGSRYSKGGSPSGRKLQKIISALGNKAIKIMCRLPVDDVSLNFKTFRKESLKFFKFNEKTNVIGIEMILDAKSNKLRIGQMPVIFSERHYGASKTKLSKLIPLYLSFFMRRIF